jgi:NADPH2:quinone reductase
MDLAVRIRDFGRPEVMQLEPSRAEAPGPQQARVRHTAIGLNYLDIYHRQGDYPLPLPTGLGVAGAGVVEATGSEVTEVRVGQRVAYAGVPPGSYAHARLVNADRLVPLPDSIGDELAAATLQQGITARFLLRDVYCVKPGDWILFHAAAGGLGTIACQWAKRLGARVIGTVGSAAKAAHAQRHGCDQVIDYSREDVRSRVMDITGGQGVQAVYDSVGQATFEASLRSLALRGTLVSFGSASGAPPAVDLHRLGELGSLYVTRPRFVHYAQRRGDLLAMASDYFARLAAGELSVTVSQRYPLSQVAQAHGDMEARKTIGSSVLIPD